MRISSTDNPIYRRLKQLATSARACREARRTLIEGVHLLQAALDCESADSHAGDARRQSNPPKRLSLCERPKRQSKAKLIELAPSLYDKISPVEHGVGVLAEIEFEMPPWPKQIVEDAIYLDNVQDPGNVGTLLRTAAAAGVRHAITGPGCAFLWSPKVMRAAMGAHFVLDLHEQVAPQTLHEAFGGEILAADATGGEDLFKAEWGEDATLMAVRWRRGRGFRRTRSPSRNRRLQIPDRQPSRLAERWCSGSSVFV